VRVDTVWDREGFRWGRKRVEINSEICKEGFRKEEPTLKGEDRSLFFCFCFGLWVFFGLCLVLWGWLC